MKNKIFLFLLGLFPSLLSAQQPTYKYEYWYDASGRLFSFRKDDSLLTSYAYDKDGNRSTQSNRKMHLSSQEYSLEENGNHVNLFPNPTTGKVNIKWAELKGAFTISIFDTWGRLLLTQEQHNMSSLDLSGYTTGIYFIRLTNEQTIATKKVLLIAP